MGSMITQRKIICVVIRVEQINITVKYMESNFGNPHTKQTVSFVLASKPHRLKTI